MTSPPPRRRLSLRHVLELVALWLVVAVPLATLLFLTGSRSTVVAGHDAVVSPTTDGYATLDLGPFLPNFRIPTGIPVGASIDLGATELDSYSALIQRYAFIASQPEGQIAKLRDTILDMAMDSALLGGLLALGAPGLVLLVGRERWEEIAHPLSPRAAAAAIVLLALLASALTLVRDDDEAAVGHETWKPLSEALPDVSVPEEAADIEVEAGLISRGTRRLVTSALASYRKSLEFYNTLAEKAPSLAPQLRQPREGESVALLVSDRHDNVGMDPVARAIGEAGGATFLLDAGDDTSTGSSWEAFSLESLAKAFADMDERYAVAGNHDNGDFVVERLQELGFTTLDGEVVDGPADTRLLGASDVRSSGLGSWRDERDVSFAEQQNLIADLACEHDADGDRISTILVHDANSGRIALERGCTDLVLAGHLHLQVGPTQVAGENGRVGYSYTNGTTGGAAYALAIGSKLRRDAEVTLVTYADGRPVGLQPVIIRTNGEFVVGDFVPLQLDAAPEE